MLNVGSQLVGVVGVVASVSGRRRGTMVRNL